MPRGVGELGVSLAEWCAQTTLMDVLAGRKTGGLTTGDIRVDGHPKDQAPFARVAGYCEQVLLTSLRSLGWQRPGAASIGTHAAAVQEPD